jgi:AcrR family transcriptional regulator
MNASTGGRKLPRGKHHLPPQMVRDHQRARLLLATAEAVAEVGCSALTVRDVLERSMVSRATFYQQFDNVRQCLVAAYRDACEQLIGAVVEACAVHRSWPEGVLAAVEAGVDFAAESPPRAALLAATNNACDPALASHVTATRDQLVGLLRSGRRHFPEAAVTPELVEQALVGGAIAVVASRVAAGRVDRLAELKPDLAQLLLTPYLGRAQAAQLAVTANLSPRARRPAPP